MEESDILVKIFRFCAYQERCHQDVYRKLRELEVAEEAKDAIMMRLEDEGFLDEARFARTFAGGRFRMKKWGRMKIRNELRRKGVAGPLIEAALKKEIPDSDYLDTLRQLIVQKDRELLRFEPQERKVRIFRYLQQKGYEWDLIQDEV